MSRIITRSLYNQQYEKYKFKIKYPVLDIGGGNGTFLETIGVEDATILDLTNNKNPKYKYITTNFAKNFPTLDNKYRTIFLTEVLEHLKNPLYIMSKVYDLLENDGNCFISIPYTKLNTKEHSSEKEDLGHVSRWKLKEIKDQMKKIGFNVEVIQTRRRFKNTAFYLPHCWIVLRLSK